MGRSFLCCLVSGLFIDTHTRELTSNGRQDLYSWELGGILQLTLPLFSDRKDTYTPASACPAAQLLHASS